MKFGMRHVGEAHICMGTRTSQRIVALGMVCTTSEDAPKTESVRCVPKSWVNETKTKPKLIWNDAGTGGAKGSFWVINEMQMLSVVQGHIAPKNTFYDFPKKVFMASEFAALR